MARFCRNCRLDFDGDDTATDVCPQCGTPLVFKCKSLFEGRYQIVRLLDMTALSQVYLASDEKMEGRSVVIKIMFKFDGNGNDDLDLSQREQQIASKVSHPNLVTIYDVGTTDAGKHYIIMEFINGYTLADVIKTEKRLGFARTAGIMLQVCDALNAIHKAGFVHKDLKPNNIILQELEAGRKDFVKLLDFGISQPLHPDKDMNKNKSQIMGTVAYMSPEQTRKNFVGILSDIYSAGIMMYEMLMGQSPFVDTDIAMIDAQRKYIPESLKLQGLADLPVAMDDLVLQMLSKDLDTRPENCEEIRTRIEHILNPWRNTGRNKNAEKKALTGKTIKLNKARNFKIHSGAIKKIMGTLPRKSGEKAAVWAVHGEQGVGKTVFMNDLADAVRKTDRMDTYVFPFLGGDYPIEVLRSLAEGILSKDDVKPVNLKSGLLTILKKTCIINPEDLVQRIVSLLQEPEKLLALDSLHAGILENYIFATIYDLLDAYSRLRPVLICLDDCHLYGEMFARFIKFMQTKAEQAYLSLAIVTIRETNGALDDGAISEKGPSGIMRLGLKPLSVTRIKKFLRGILPLPPEPDLEKEIITKSNGYPGQVIEYCRYINSFKAFTEDGGMISIINNDVLKSVPPTIEEMYKRRLNVLRNGGSTGIKAIEILERVALAGPLVTKDLLSGILETEGRLDLKSGLDSLLSRLIREGYILSGYVDSQKEIRISHPMLGLVLKNSVLENPKPEMMVAIAYEIEKRFQKQLPDYYETLALLYKKAGYSSKAINFYTLLARQSNERLNLYNAAMHFQTARMLMKQDSMENSPRWRTVCRELGRTLKDMGKYTEALAAYSLPATPAQVQNASPDELKELLEITQVLLELREEKTVNTMLNALIRRCDDSHAPLMSASCHLMRARIHSWHGKTDKAGKELRAAQSGLKGHAVTPVHWQLALRHAELATRESRPGESIKVLERIITRLEQSGYYTMEIEALFFMGASYIQLGKLDLAEDAFSRGYRLSIRYAFKKGMARHILNLANVHIFKNDFELAKKEAVEAMDINSADIGDPLLETSANITLSYLHLCTRKMEDAERYIQASLFTSREHKYDRGIGEATLNQAILFAYQERWIESEAALKKAESILLGDREDTKAFSKPEIECMKGKILQHKGKSAEAGAMFLRSFKGFLKMGRLMEAGMVRKILEESDKNVDILT